MAVIVVMARIAYGISGPTWFLSSSAMWAIVALGASTALARLTIFMGVKKLGACRPP
jgi:hypothetical protein